jgi:hypothetical protein
MIFLKSTLLNTEITDHPKGWGYLRGNLEANTFDLWLYTYLAHFLWILFGENL